MNLSLQTVINQTQQFTPMMQHYAPTLGRCYLLRPHPQLPLNSSSSVIINILPTTYTLKQQFDQASPTMPYILLAHIITSKFGDEQWQQKFT